MPYTARAKGPQPGRVEHEPDIEPTMTTIVLIIHLLIALALVRPDAAEVHLPALEVPPTVVRHAAEGDAAGHDRSARRLHRVSRDGDAGGRFGRCLDPG